MSPKLGREPPYRHIPQMFTKKKTHRGAFIRNEATICVMIALGDLFELGLLQ